MKCKTLLTLIGLLSATGLPALAQEAENEAIKFIMHTGTATSYVGITTLDEGAEYLRQAKNGRGRNELSSKFEIGLFSRFNPKLDLIGNVYGAPVKSISKTYPSYIIPDSSAVQLVAIGITEKNIKDYKYHVVKNDSIELIPWSPIPKLENKYGTIGIFNSPGDIIMIEVVHTKNYNTRDAVIYDWRADYRPVLSSIGVNIDGYHELINPEPGNPYSKKSTDGNSQVHLWFPADSLLGMRLGFRHHETIPYNITLEKLKGDSVAESSLINHEFLRDYQYVDHEWLRQPGKYRIKIVRTESTPGQYDKKQARYIPFEIKPPPITDKKVSLKQALPYILATLSGVALLFYLFYRNNQRKLKSAALEKQQARLKLISIRAQLNPHFMFNALTSIQNLINKNHIESANYYLSIFSGLTRQVLDTGNEETLSLEEELKLLDDYLLMEQLRFGFAYQITTDEQINRPNTEIPAMLLQPFAENAVKHGVSGLKERGNVTIRVSQENQDLLLSVADNGAGFVKTAVAASYGLKLTEERIALLNQIYKGQSVTLSVDTAASGTVITIRLINWIS